MKLLSLALAAVALCGCFTVFDAGLLLARQERADLPTIAFVNELPEPVCAVNLWRPGQPEDEAIANWLELTELSELLPQQRVEVGVVLRDSPYFLRAVGCGERARPLYEARLGQLRAGETLFFRLTPPDPPPSPTLGL